MQIFPKQKHFDDFVESAFSSPESAVLYLLMFKICLPQILHSLVHTIG